MLINKKWIAVTTRTCSGKSVACVIIFNLRASLIVILSLIYFPMQIHGKSICAGVDCSVFSQNIILGLNAIDPLLPGFYSNSFFHAMSESAVLNNINSSMPSNRNLAQPEIGFGYSMTKTELENRNPLIKYTELNQLPKDGGAISPALHYGNSVSNIFKIKSSTLSKLNLNIHFFPYGFNEIQIPFANIKNMNVNGKVFNFGLSARYFPEVPRWNLFGMNLYLDGISLGSGLFYTSQDARFDSYDRKTTQLKIPGESRRWAGMNEMNYASSIYTGNIDARAGLSYSRFFLYTGLGYAMNSAYSSINVQRIAAISASKYSNDFASRPTAVILNIDEKYIKQFNTWFFIYGLEIQIGYIKIQAEVLNNSHSLSGNIGIKYLYYSDF